MASGRPGWWKRRFMTDPEIKRAEKKAAREELEGLEHEERREKLREWPGQMYEIEKDNHDGNGNKKLLDREIETAPDNGDVNTRYQEVYGGGIYRVYALKPTKTIYLTVPIHGEPLYPNKRKGSKKPLDKLLDRVITNMGDDDMAKLTPALLAKGLGLPQETNNPFMDTQAQNLRTAIATTLFNEGKLAEAANVLGGGKVKDEKKGDTLDELLKENAKENLKKHGSIYPQGGMGSEKAQEITAMTGMAQVIAQEARRAVKDIVMGLTTGEVSDDEEEARYVCGRCKGYITEEQAKSGTCNLCGFVFDGSDSKPAHPPAYPDPPITDIVTPTLPPPYNPPIDDEFEDQEGDLDVAHDDPIGEAPWENGDFIMADETPTEPEVSEAPPKPAPLSKDEEKFLLKVLPLIFMNRIKRSNGEKHEPRFRLLPKVGTQKRYSDPLYSAQYDLDYLLKHRGPEAVRKSYAAAKVGFHGMVGKYQNFIDAEERRLGEYMEEFLALGPKKFLSTYSSVTKEDIKDLKRYKILKPMFIYLKQDHAQKWWETYCGEYTQLVETNHPAIIAGIKLKKVKKDVEEPAEFTYSVTCKNCQVVLKGGAASMEEVQIKADGLFEPHALANPDAHPEFMKAISEPTPENYTAFLATITISMG